ncbi:MAG: 3-keto-5-aminohexanoate cleavage protein [marine bacterium B5-7]|nr:MAG: 3-keto-5-aminohexanoate cleavage protein [marine bacterium B5-7]
MTGSTKVKTTTRKTPIIIAAAPTGAYKTPTDYPGLPITTEQIVDEAERCAMAGASMLHLHVRNSKGLHTLDATCYEKAINTLRERLGDSILIQVTTEAAGRYEAMEQFEAIIKIQSNFISLALAETVRDGTSQDLDRTTRLFEYLDLAGVSVQIILYSSDQVTQIDRLMDDGIIPRKNYPLLFVLGRYMRSRDSLPTDLDPFIDAMAHDMPFMVCAFGQHEIDCMRYAVECGGHARVGFENNVLKPDGSALADSAESVSLTAKTLSEHGFMIANADDARRLLGVHD